MVTDCKLKRPAASTTGTSGSPGSAQVIYNELCAALSSSGCSLKILGWCDRSSAVCFDHVCESEFKPGLQVLCTDAHAEVAAVLGFTRADVWGLIEAHNVSLTVKCTREHFGKVGDMPHTSLSLKVSCAALEY